MLLGDVVPPKKERVVCELGCSHGCCANAVAGDCATETRFSALPKSVFVRRGCDGDEGWFVVLEPFLGGGGPNSAKRSADILERFA